MSKTSKFLILGLFLAALAGCGGNNDQDACEGVVCLDTTHCVVQDSGPACVPD